MTFARTLFARFGLIRAAVEAPDLFDLRLVRIGTREGRRNVQASLFRS